MQDLQGWRVKDAGGGLFLYLEASRLPDFSAWLRSQAEKREKQRWDFSVCICESRDLVRLWPCVTRGHYSRTRASTSGEPSSLHYVSHNEAGFTLHPPDCEARSGGGGGQRGVTALELEVWTSIGIRQPEFRKEEEKGAAKQTVLPGLHHFFSWSSMQ